MVIPPIRPQLEQATAYPKEAGGLVYGELGFVRENASTTADRPPRSFSRVEGPGRARRLEVCRGGEALLRAHHVSSYQSPIGKGSRTDHRFHLGGPLSPNSLSPTWVTGSSSEASLKTFADLRSSHGLTVQSLYGVKAFPDAGMASSFVDVQDVAKAHIGALTTPEAQGKRYLLVGGQFNYEEAAKAIVKAVPEAEKAFPHVEGKAFAPSFAVDASAAEKAFGFTCESWC